MNAPLISLSLSLFLSVFLTQCVVFFNQQMDAMHFVCWLINAFSILFNLFASFERKKGNMRWKGAKMPLTNTGSQLNTGWQKTYEPGCELRSSMFCLFSAFLLSKGKKMKIVKEHILTFKQGVKQPFPDWNIQHQWLSIYSRSDFIRFFFLVHSNDHF